MMIVALIMDGKRQDALFPQEEKVVKPKLMDQLNHTTTNTGRGVCACACVQVGGGEREYTVLGIECLGYH